MENAGLGPHRSHAAQRPVEQDEAGRSHGESDGAARNEHGALEHGRERRCRGPVQASARRIEERDIPEHVDDGDAVVVEAWDHPRFERRGNCRRPAGFAALERQCLDPAAALVAVGDHHRVADHDRSRDASPQRG